jgi:hypothetical protein
MRRRIALALAVVAFVVASVAPAAAHSPTCHYGTQYPYMYLYRVRYGTLTYRYYYANVSTSAVHYDVCRYV